MCIQIMYTQRCLRTKNLYPTEPFECNIGSVGQEWSQIYAHEMKNYADTINIKNIDTKHEDLNPTETSKYDLGEDLIWKMFTQITSTRVTCT